MKGPPKGPSVRVGRKFLFGKHRAAAWSLTATEGKSRFHKPVKVRIR
jgi:hypothetical protein